MVARVTAAEVKNLYGKTNVSDSVITDIMIDTAHTLTDNRLSNKNLPADLLEKIELFLSAHFLAVSEERGALAESRLGEAESHLAENIFGPGLSSTRFGQQAIALDPSGSLATTGAGTGTAQFRVISARAAA